MYILIWLYLIYAYIWPLPGVGKSFLNARLEKSASHYFTFILSAGLIAEIIIRAPEYGTPLYSFVGVCVIYLLACFAQANSGYQGRDSAYSIFFAALNIGLFFSTNYLMDFLGLDYAVHWQALIAMNSLYLYIENFEVGIKKSAIHIQWKGVFSTMLVGASLLFVSQEIYPSLKFEFREPNFDQILPLLISFSFIEIIPRVLAQKKLILDTLTTPYQFQLVFVTLAQLAAYYFVWGGDYFPQYFILSFCGALLYYQSRQLSVSLFYTTMMILVLNSILPFPKIL